MRSNIYTALDIGSSKISCVIFEVIFKSNEIRILGYSTKYSIGIRGGIIENITEANTSISSAVYEAEKQASVSAKKVIANVSHPFTNSKIIITDSNFGGRQLTSKDLKNISDKVLYSANQSKRSIIQFCPVRYDVDTMRNIAEPEYMFVNNLKSHHTVITVPKTSLMLFKKCLRDLHLNPIHCVLSSCASSLSFDLENLRNFLVLDIGGGVSDIAVFERAHCLLWAGSIPLGGESITRDIAGCFAISYKEAEKLKVLYGNLTPGSSEVLSLNSDALKTKVNISMLNRVILARIEEMIEIILNKIPKEYKIKTIILTGGVAKTLGLAELISTKFNIKAKLGVHSDFASCFGETLKSDPTLSTTIGLMHYHLKETSKRKSFSIRKIFEWMWENF